MTPTNEQTEAAQELHQVASDLCHPEDCKLWLQKNYKLLSAALTAAAEVEDNPLIAMHGPDLIAEAVAAEREACAVVAENLEFIEVVGQVKFPTAREIAAAIRARGDTEDMTREES